MYVRYTQKKLVVYSRQIIHMIDTRKCDSITIVD
jgi:hypothetical protein